MKIKLVLLLQLLLTLSCTANGPENVHQDISFEINRESTLHTFFLSQPIEARREQHISLLMT